MRMLLGAAFLSVVLIVIASAIAQPCRAGVLFVCPGCEYTSVYFTSIDSAVVAANPYDTIIVRRGRYSSAGILISKPLTMIGRERDSVILTRTAPPDGPIFTITTDSCVIRNFTFEIVGGNSLSSGAIECLGASPNITDNTFLVQSVSNWPAFALICQGNSSPVITRNDFYVTSDRSHFAIYLKEDPMPVSAAGNYWGGLTSETISGVIIDHGTNSSLGTVSTTPAVDVPY